MGVGEGPNNIKSADCKIAYTLYVHSLTQSLLCPEKTIRDILEKGG